MKGLDLIFRLDRHRRFLSQSLALDQMLWADRPASDCADRPLSGRDFASPATSSVNHSRGDLRECHGFTQRKTVRFNLSR